MRMSCKLVFHESKCITAIKAMRSTTATYIYPRLLYVFVYSLLL